MTANPRSDARPTLLIAGGGIAGMTAAHELHRHFAITLIERNRRLGGKCRSWLDPEAQVPVEHGWRFFNATYHNLFDTLRRIPFGAGRSVFDNLRRKRQRPGIYVPALLKRHAPFRARDLWEAGRDAIRLLRILGWSDERIRRFHATDLFETHLARPGRKNLVHGLIRDFLGIIWSTDKSGFDVQVTRNMLDNFVVNRLRLFNLNGPTSDTFIEPWRRHLEDRGVEILAGARLSALRGDGGARVGSAAWVDDASSDVHERSFDYYLSAIPNDALLTVLGSDLLDAAGELRSIDRFERAWQNGVMVYTRSRQDLRMNSFHEHPWKITVVSQAEHWGVDHDFSRYGTGDSVGTIADVLSYVVTDWNAVGPATGKIARDCSPDEIYEELCFASEADPAVVANFDRRDHVAFPSPAGARRCVVDESLRYGTKGSRIVANEDTVVTCPPGTFHAMPRAETPIRNLFLASTYCFNAFGCCATMEGANETGRRAAGALLRAVGSDERVPVFDGKRAGLVMRLLLARRRRDARRLGAANAGGSIPA